jgi:hypothetical protein
MNLQQTSRIQSAFRTGLKSYAISNGDLNSNTFAVSNHQRTPRRVTLSRRRGRG